jgi:hypothetical protein
MLRPWIIRSLALALVLCFLMAWAASYWVTAIFVHYVAMGGGSTGQNGFVAIRTGQISFLREGPLLSADWQASLTSNTYTDWWVPEFLDGYSAGAKFRFLGFYFDNGTDLFVSIPLWLPTILAGLFLWWVWRKTRGNLATRGFPVEVSVPHRSHIAESKP